MKQKIKDFFIKLWAILKVCIAFIGIIFFYFKIKKYINNVLVSKTIPYSVPFKIINKKTLAIDVDGETIGINLPDSLIASDVDAVYLPDKDNEVEVIVNHEKVNRRNNVSIDSNAYDVIKSRK